MPFWSFIFDNRKSSSSRKEARKRLLSKKKSSKKNGYNEFYDQSLLTPPASTSPSTSRVDLTIDTQDESFENSCYGDYPIVDYSSEEESVSSYQEKLKRYGVKSPQDTATCLNNLGVVLQSTGLKASGGPTYGCSSNRDLGSFLRRSTNDDGAERDHESSIRMSANKSVASSTKSDASSINSNETASAAYRASLKMKKKQFGNSHPSIATTLNNLASVFFSEGKFHRALKYYKKSLKIMMKHLGPDDINVATIWNNIGDVHHAMQEDEVAFQSYNHALRIRREYLSETDIRVVRLIEKIDFINWKKKIAESHEKGQYSEHRRARSLSPDGFSNLRQELSSDIAKVDEMCDTFSGDITFHVELMSRKRDRRSDESLGRRKRQRF